MKLRGIVIIFLVFFLALSFAWADSEGNSTELQDKIDSASQTLDLDKNYNLHTEAKGVEVEDLSIDGHNVTIFTSDYCINVKGDVKFKNIRFDGRKIIGGTCNSLEISNCTFNGAFGNDVALINVSSGRISISNCRILSYACSEDQFSCNLKANNLSISNSTFERTYDWNNQLLTVDAGNFEIRDCKFLNSNTEGLCGALYIKRGEGLIYNTEFTGNEAGSASAIYVGGSKVKIVKSSFKSNKARKSAVILLKGSDNLIDDCVFEANEVAEGGVVTVTGKSNTIRNSQFKNCDFAISATADNLNIVDSQFTSCREVMVINGNGAVVKGSTFTNSPGIVLNGKNALVENSKFSNPKETSVKIKGAYGQVKGCEFTKCWYALDVQGAGAKVLNSKFTNVEFTLYLGANGLVDNCIFKDSTATDNLLIIHGANCIIRNSKFQNNKGFYSVMTVEGKKCTLQGCEFTSNTCQKGSTVIWAAKDGIVKNCVFKYNKGAKGYDGALDSGLDFDVKISGSTFYKNTPEKVVIVLPKTYVVQYGSGTKYKFKVYCKNSKKPLSGVKFDMYVKPGTNLNIVAKTNSKGIVMSKDLSRVDEYGPIGIDVTITLPKGYFQTAVDMEDLYVPYTMVKGKAIVKAPKVVAKQGQSKKLKIKITHKVSKKPIKKIKVKLKVYTGKKVQKYTIKTNKKGVAKFNTRGLSRGTHKVVITSGIYEYTFKKVSQIKIK